MVHGVTPEDLRRLTDADVLRMVEVGILAEDESVELLGGELFQMSPQGPRHGFVTTILRDCLVNTYGKRATVRQENPLSLGPNDLPEPDLAVVKGAASDYQDRYPTASDCLLVIEVSVTSQQRDLAKADVYARAGVPEYWLIDVAADRVTRFTQPQPDGFSTREVLSAVDEIAAPDSTVRWPVADLLGIAQS